MARASSVRWLALGVALALVSCGSPTEPTDASTAPPDASDAGGPRVCATDAECDDGVFCNGDERCVTGACTAGAAPDCDDGVACTRDICSETRRECRNLVRDEDGDGVGDAACSGRDGVALGTDCDDGDAMRFPGNEELCDEADRDEDCDPSTLGRLDLDGDRYGSSACCNVGADGTRHCGLDCDDTRAQVSPEATEACDGFDNDCDGRVDEGVGGTFYLDRDRDGHGDPSTAMSGCATTSGRSTLGDDCDDGSAARQPAQPEFCDATDNDCDERVDEDAAPVPWYPDADGDGFGQAGAAPRRSCTPLADHSLLGTDCDDGAAARNPAATELCDGVDNDCSGEADYALGVNDLEDDDEDGLADVACGAPAGQDCDDRDPATGTGEIERCDGRDNDCDARVDEFATSVVWYQDADGDGYGSGSSGAMVACAPVPGYVRRAGDCDDTDATRVPGAPERCDGADDDCDGAVDEAPASSGCALPGARSACIAGACVIVACEPDLADCNDDPSDGCERALGTTSDCAGCGDACGAPRATFSCVARTCVLARCNDGYDDCNAFAGDGCETNLQTDPDDCGACGTRCGGPNASSRCSAGVCRIDACSAGWGDCNGVASDGCEQRLDAAAHCGACGRACTGGATCEAGGFCRAVCGTGFADCDGNPSNGCETDTRTSATNCGRCGNACTLANTSSTCSMGSCQVLGCIGPWSDCDGSPTNGCETPLGTLTDCRGCRDACNFFNASSVCGAGGCSIGACAPGWGDCNATTSDGCELDLRFNPYNCNACGAACSLPNAAELCNAGTCGVGGCDPGWGDCDGLATNGCEQSVLSDARHCGACGRSCGAAGMCEGGFCDGVRQVVRGADFSCALRDRGGVACWGGNGFGQLGRVTAGAGVPATVPLPSAAISIAAGATTACAVLATGEVYCWGDNALGQLGRGALSPSFSPTPAKVDVLYGAVSVAVGASHACAATNTGALYCWGSNALGQIGVGSTVTTFATAQLVSTLSDVREVVAGAQFSCARSGAGLHCWGDNAFGQLGDGTTVPRYSPVIAGTTSTFDVTRMVAGSSFVCVLRSAYGGVVDCWGDDRAGQLGDGTSATSRPTPVRFIAPSIVDVSSGADHTCVLTTVGTTLCVGRDVEAQLGRGGPGAPVVATPAAPTTTTSFLKLGGTNPTSAGTCATQREGHLYCWGSNGSGESSGAPTMGPSLVPTQVTGVY